MAKEADDRARAASRQIKAALALRRRYQALTGKTLSITAVRQSAASLDAFLEKLSRIGDEDLLRLAAVAFDLEYGVDTSERSVRGAVDPALSTGNATAPPRRRVPVIALNLLAALALIVVIVLAARSGGGSSGVAVAEDARDVAGSAPLFALSGSNTIGEHLGPLLVQAYLKSQGFQDVSYTPDQTGVDGQIHATNARDGAQVRVDLHAHGSATAFTALDKGEAQIGMASRPINAEERSHLMPVLGDLSQAGSEHVLGLDGIAVIVNPSNPVRTLTVEQVARIFSGDIHTWAGVGGPARQIHLFARDGKSGTWDTFKALVLDRHGRGLSAEAARLESSTELSDSVSADRDAIGFVGLAYIRTATALAIADVADGRALTPTAFTVSTEDYPLSRRLYLYTPATTKNAAMRLRVAQFVDFALSAAGQEVVQQAGFIPQRATPATVAPRADQPDEYRRVASDSQRLSLSFRFRAGSNDMDTKALRDIDRVLAYLAEKPSARIVLMGFTDSTGNNNLNLALARERAQSVQNALAQRGVSVSQLLALGAAMPLASNESDLGRQKNRRVEIWVKG